MKYKKYIIYIVAFLAGFAFMGYEIIGSRMLAPYFGSSVYVWGAMITVFMIGLSFGYYLGGKLAIKQCNKYRDLFWGFIFIFAFVFIVSAIFRYICMFVLRFDIDIRISALMVSFMLFFVPSIFWGIFPPCFISILTDKIEYVGQSVGRLYAFSTAGSIAGVIIVSFYMIGWFGTSLNVKLLACIFLICSIALAVLMLVDKKQNQIIICISVTKNIDPS